jgi:hypothetical protein
MRAALATTEEDGEEPASIVTTLYDLMETLQDEAGCEDDLVVASVMGLLQTGRLALLRQVRHLQPFRATLEGLSYS